MADSKASPRGTNPKLAVIGGRLEDDNAAIYAELHRMSGGRILIFPTASGEPEAVGAETLAVFQAHGFEAALAPVFGAGAGAGAQDAAVVAMIRDFGSVFFTGGDQALITGALAPGGLDSPTLAAIRATHAAGGLIAGSSAGAAVMSDVMIEGGTSLEAATYGTVTNPAQPGLLLGRGFGFFPWGVVDQHFIKRGRFGRLVVAMAERGVARGFGVDENTALFVDGARAHVIGEFGAFVLGMDHATRDRRRHTIAGIAVSYADDGDQIDLETGAVLPGPDKRPVEGRDIAYRAPARSLRNVFGAYTLYDLLARLVLGDPDSYPADRARAIEPKAGVATSVEFSRTSTSRAYMTARERDFRMTALDFRALLSSRKLNPAQLAENRRAALSHDYGVRPGKGAQMMMLGSSPLGRDGALLDHIARHARGPVGIIAAASSEPGAEAQRYIRALGARGIEAQDLAITIDNVERLGRDEALIRRIEGLETILLTGGNQIRLIETLLHRGEVTPVLMAIARAQAAGAMVVAVSGAASALSGFMIAGGTSYEALRFGIASDMGRRGLVIQEGLGLFGAAIVDQNFDSAHRLARLAVACAEEGVRCGIGIMENSGVIADHDGTRLAVIGAAGAALIEIDLEHTEARGDDFIAPRTRLAFAGPGDVIDLSQTRIIRASPPDRSAAALEKLVADVVADCCATPTCAARPGQTPGRATQPPISMRFTSEGDGTGHLDIQSIRDRHG